MEDKSLFKQMFSPSRLYPVILILICFLVFRYRQYKTQEYQKENVDQSKNFISSDGYCIVKGMTMGHIPYNVKYVAEGLNLKTEIDSVLKEFNKVFSTYIPSSQISLINNNDTVCGVSDDLLLVLNKSKEIAEKTHSYFDPTVMPLVNAWGFGYESHESLPSDSVIHEILQYVGVEKVYIDGGCVMKLQSKTQLDFSAIAKGYASDVVSRFLKSKGLTNSMVEIGGEVTCSGTKKGGSSWKIGVEKPSKDKSDIVLIVSVDNQGIATSGNYRNYISSEGKDYGHTINPHSGKVADTDMLSATVKAKTCLEADAYATAFMAIGAKKSVVLLKELNQLEVFFIYKDGDEVKQYKSENFE